ncbi:penicillin-binding transpeptidase domain-containing protein [Paludifilum halophilum]|uniref:penicillin-binding transpeptidase domain-containing protein n=1 Tax=Paludifilum halophilum TaxID=1642702 RepID=UPI0034DEF183
MMPPVDSTIWYFQEVARRVGESKEQEFLHVLHYGNRDLSGGLTRFWLQSSLKISSLRTGGFS